MTFADRHCFDPQLDCKNLVFGVLDYMPVRGIMVDGNTPILYSV